MLSIYPACFYHDSDGYSVIFPDLNWLSTCGKDMNEAMNMAVDCLAGYLFMCQMDGEDFPVPSPIDKINPIEVAKELDSDNTSIEAFVNVISVDVELYAKTHFEKSVKKTLSIPRWLNDIAISKGINFSQVLQEALIQKVHHTP